MHKWLLILSFSLCAYKFILLTVTDLCVKIYSQQPSMKKVSDY